MASPTRMLTKAEAKTITLAPGTLIAERNGWQLWHGQDLLDETRGGRLCLRINRAVVKGPNGHCTFYPMTVRYRAEAKGHFDRAVTP